MKLIRTSIAAVCTSLFLYNQANAQTVLRLQDAIGYAKAHNLTIQQSAVNEQLYQVIQTQSQLAQLPSVNAGASYGRNFYHTTDPVADEYIHDDFNFATVNGSVNLLLFGWLQQRNTIEKNKLNHQAAVADLTASNQSVTWNVASNYLNVLVTKEQMLINQKQLQTSRLQLEQTRKFMKAGTVPDLSVAQLEAQLAGDSAQYIASSSLYTAALIDLKTTLNMDLNSPIDVAPPTDEKLIYLPIATWTPEAIYDAASKNLGIVKSSDLKLAAARKGLSAAEGGLYPQLSIGAVLASNYYSTAFAIAGYKEQATGLYDGNHNPIMAESAVYESNPIGLGSQFGKNFQKLVGVNLVIPIFNGWAGRTAVREARLNVQSADLSKQQTTLKLHQDVYKAFYDVRNAIQTYTAAKHAYDAAARALNYARQRYNVGLSNTVEYLVILNTSYTAESRLLAAKYDLVFKQKLVDFYMGNELKL